MEIKKCRWCGKKFETEIGEQFCSDSCYAEWRSEVYDKREPRICPVCHSEFIPTTYNNIYCSKECYRKSAAEKKKAFRKDHPENHRAENQRYYRKHRKKVGEYVKGWQKRNPERVKEIHRNYRKRNREKLAEDLRVWRKRNKLDACCKKHGGIDNCPFPDCICE